MRDRSENYSAIAIGERGGASRPVLHADVHQAAHKQAEQLVVGKVGWREQGREHIHGGPHFRIAHQRQIDQTLDRLALKVVPDRLRFGLDMLPGRVGRDVDAEKAQAGDCAGHGLRAFRPHDMQLHFEMMDGRLVDVRRSALQ